MNTNTIPKFKRTQTEFEGGSADTEGGRYVDYVPSQRVQILGIKNEEEDTWLIGTPQDRYIVDGDTLKPHPTDPETNVERLTRFCEWSRHGGMGQVFVIEAIIKYAEMVEAMPQEQRDAMAHSIISYELWASVAKEAREFFTDRD